MFKVGERVRHQGYGEGTVKIVKASTPLQNLVEFDKEATPLHDGNQPDIKFKDKHCWWCLDTELTLIQSDGKMNLSDACNLLLENPKREARRQDGTVFHYNAERHRFYWASGEEVLLRSENIKSDFTIIEPPRAVVFEMKEMPVNCAGCPVMSSHVYGCECDCSAISRPSTCPLKYKDEYVKEATNDNL